MSRAPFGRPTPACPPLPENAPGLVDLGCLTCLEDAFPGRFGIPEPAADRCQPPEALPRTSSSCPAWPLIRPARAWDSAAAITTGCSPCPWRPEPRSSACATPFSSWTTSRRSLGQTHAHRHHRTHNPLVSLMNIFHSPFPACPRWLRFHHRQPHARRTRRSGRQPGLYRRGRPDRVIANRQDIKERLKFSIWHSLRQVHGVDMIFEPEFDTLTRRASKRATAWPNRAPTALAIKTADCQPVLLAHESGQFIAALHVGWRATRPISSAGPCAPSACATAWHRRNFWPRAVPVSARRGPIHPLRGRVRRIFPALFRLPDPTAGPLRLTRDQLTKPDCARTGSTASICAPTICRSFSPTAGTSPRAVRPV